MLRIFIIIGLLLGAAALVEYVMPADDGIAYAQNERNGRGGGDNSSDDDGNADGRDLLWWVPRSNCIGGGKTCGLRIRADTPKEECRPDETLADCCARLGGVERCACEGPRDQPEACYNIGLMILVMVAQPSGQETKHYFWCGIAPSDNNASLAWFEQACAHAASGEDYETTGNTLTFEPAATSDVPQCGLGCRYFVIQNVSPNSAVTR